MAEEFKGSLEDPGKPEKWTSVHDYVYQEMLALTKGISENPDEVTLEQAQALQDGMDRIEDWLAQRKIELIRQQAKSS